MTQIQSVLDSYIAAWNEGNPERRRSLVGQAFTSDARYLDPLMSGEGVEGIASMIAAAREQYPGHRFDLIEAPDAHNDRVRFSWALSAGDEPPVAVGVDFATVADDGRLRDVTGFIVQS